MNTDDGKIHAMRNGEKLRDLAERIGVPEENLVALGKEPEPDCPRCGGKGSVHAGIGSKRFKPCKCTYA